MESVKSTIFTDFAGIVLRILPLQNCVADKSIYNLEENVNMTFIYIIKLYGMDVWMVLFSGHCKIRCGT